MTNSKNTKNNLGNQFRNIELEHFKNIVAIAFADGYLDDAEIEFMSERATEMGLDDADVKKVLNNAHLLQFEIPLNKVDRDEQLTDSVYMAMIDGKLDKKEYAMCLNVASKLGFDKRYLDHAIQLIQKMWKNIED